MSAGVSICLKVTFCVIDTKILIRVADDHQMFPFLFPLPVKIPLRVGSLDFCGGQGVLQRKRTYLPTFMFYLFIKPKP